MKITVVGCGALGSFYGGRLCRDGHEVHFLLRSDFDVVQREGIFVRSVEGDFHVRPRCGTTPAAIGVSDLVLIGLKTTANHEFDRLLPPLVGPGTLILTLQNGLGNEEQLARLFPPKQVLGGLAFVCLNRIEPGVIHHIDHGRIVIGEFQRRSLPRTHDLAALFQQAGISCDVTDDLARAHWEKLVWNIPFNGLGVASAAGIEAVLDGDMGSTSGALLPCLTTDRLLADPRWETLVRELMREVIAAANALGHDLAVRVAEEEQMDRTRTMGAYKPSTVLDFEQRRPLEMEALFLEPLRQAKGAGVHSPRLSALCRVLQQLGMEGLTSGSGRTRSLDTQNRSHRKS